jgi:hypothetical protein
MMDLQVLLPILMSWAVYFSDYPMPEEMPQVEFEPHGFFVDKVCAGKECNAVGWYNDESIIYIDEKYRDSDASFATSLVVHELTHYLQHLSGRFDSFSCRDSLAREREAYGVQNNYLVTAQGSFDIIHPAPTACQYAADHDVRLTAYGQEPPGAQGTPAGPAPRRPPEKAALRNVESAAGE